MEGNGDYDVKEKKSAYKDNITHFLSYVESIYKREKRQGRKWLFEKTRDTAMGEEV